MKKVLALILVALAFNVNAQEFKKFKVGLGLGYASPSGSGAKGGVLVYMEPAYRVTDQIQVGLRMESAVLVRGLSNADGSAVDFDASAIGSYTVNAQYYFNNNGFRPFVGAGLGVFPLAAISADINGNSTSTDLVKKETKFGFYPRAGFDAGHFTFSIDYNLIPVTKVGGDVEVKNSYLGFRIGAFFGGGRK